MDQSTLYKQFYSREHMLDLIQKGYHIFTPKMTLQIENIPKSVKNYPAQECHS
jgi:hypothetical protein